MTTAPDGTRRRALAAGSALALGTAVLWIAITAWSGKTYHLAPLLAAAAPGWTARAAGARLNPPSRFATAAAGLAAAGLGWAAIRVLAIEPAATVIRHQPGGVPAEVAAAALLGVALGQVSLFRALRRLAGPAGHAPAARQDATPARSGAPGRSSPATPEADVPHQPGPEHRQHDPGARHGQAGEHAPAGARPPALRRQPSRKPKARP